GLPALCHYTIYEGSVGSEHRLMFAPGQTRPRRSKPYDRACPLHAEDGQVDRHLAKSALCQKATVSKADSCIAAKVPLFDPSPASASIIAATRTAVRHRTTFDKSRSNHRVPRRRDEPIAAAGLLDVAEAGEREVIARDQELVGRSHVVDAPA